MAAGIQFNAADHLACFQPSVDQYLRKIEQAVISDDPKAAQQALGQLERMLSASAQAGGKGTGSPSSEQLMRGLQDVRTALESNDLASAGYSLRELAKGTASTRSGSSDAEGSAEQNSSAGASPENEQTDSILNLDLNA